MMHLNKGWKQKKIKILTEKFEEIPLKVWKNLKTKLKLIRAFIWAFDNLYKSSKFFKILQTIKLLLNVQRLHKFEFWIIKLHNYVI